MIEINKQSANRLQQLLGSCVISFQQVILWADTHIEQLEQPPSWLCDLAVSKDTEHAMHVLKSYVFSEPFEEMDQSATDNYRYHCCQTRKWQENDLYVTPNQRNRDVCSVYHIEVDPANATSGQAFSQVHFDEDEERDRVVSLEVVKAQERQLMGVETRFVELLTKSDNHAATRAIVSADGITLAAQGAGLRFRLENKALAQSGIKGVAWLGLAVPVDKPIGDPKRVGNWCCVRLELMGAKFPPHPISQ